jgi:DNA-binding CsgD family transcriptional regulator
MTQPAGASILDPVAPRLRSGSALCAFDEELRIVAWNEAAEALTGIPACEALDRPCWSVLGGTADDGSLVCHRGCSGARLARDGWPLRPQTLMIKTAAGRRRVTVDTLTTGDVVVHVMRPASRLDPRDGVPSVRLTPRRLQVLRLLADGMSVRRIAARMGVRESTARNHVHALLVDLDAHSMLEAVSRGRAEGLI